MKFFLVSGVTVCIGVGSAMITYGQVDSTKKIQIQSEKQHIGTSGPAKAKHMRDVKLDKSAILIKPRTPLANTVILMTETGKPGGKPINQNQKVTLEKGRTATTKELIDGTNELERNLNSLGYSLFTDSDDAKPIIPIIQANHSANFVVQRQKLKMTKDPKLKVSTTKRNIAQELLNIYKAPLIVENYQPIDPALVIGAAKAMVNQKAYDDAMKDFDSKRYKGPTSIHKDYDLPEQVLGDPNWFAVSFSAGIHTHVTTTMRDIKANADVTSTLFNHSASIFHGLAEVGGSGNMKEVPPIKTPATPDGSPGGKIRVELQVLGEDVIPPVNQSTTGSANLGHLAKDVGFEYSLSIPIIPGISATGTIGAKGSAGLDISASTTGVDGSLNVSPFVNTAVYAELGVTASIAIASIEGGIGADMTLLNYQLNFSAGLKHVRVMYNGIPTHAYSVPIDVSQNVNALSGHLYGFVRVGYWLPFHTHHKTLWKGDLLSWPGVTDNETLFSVDSTPIPISTFDSAYPKKP